MSTKLPDTGDNRPPGTHHGWTYTSLPLPNVVKRKRSSVRDSEGVSMRAGWEVCDDEFRRQLMRKA